MSFDLYKDRIIAGESGGNPNALYGNRAGYGTPTEMTFGEVFYDLAAPDGAYAKDVRNELGYTATPVGLYQVVGDTGRSMMEKHGIDPNLPFTPENQEMLARLIYDEQGPGAWEALKKKGSGPVSARDHINQFDQMLAFEAEPMSQRHQVARVLGNAGDRMMALGSGRGLPQMLRGDLQYQNNEKRHGRNQTAQYLSKMGMHDLASAVATGEMSGGAAMNLMYQYGGVGGAGGSTEYGTTVRYGTDPDGSQFAYVVGKDGSVKRLDSNGADLGGGVMKVDTETGTVLLDKATGAPIGHVGDDAGGARMRDMGIKYNEAVDMYSQAAPLMEQLFNHPGMDAATGPVAGNYDLTDPAQAALLSEDGRAFANLHNQLRSKAFLQAFESLKGGGPITDVEGQAATDALIRVNRATSSDEYRKALIEFNKHLQHMVKKYDDARNGVAPQYNPVTLGGGGGAVVPADDLP